MDIKAGHNRQGSTDGICKFVSSLSSSLEQGRIFPSPEACNYCSLGKTGRQGPGWGLVFADRCE
jgi:hypothetical protein